MHRTILSFASSSPPRRRGAIPLLLAVLAALAWAAPAAAQETLSGVFHLAWRDALDPREPSEVAYHLTDDGGRTYRLELNPEQLEPYGGAVALIGRRVRVTAALRSVAEGEDGGSRLRVLSLRPEEPAGPRRASAVQNGPKPYATVLCRFADSAQVPHPVEWYRARLEETGPNTLDHYWREVSHGHMDLTGSQVAAAWVDLPRTVAQYHPDGLQYFPDLQAMAADCTAAADALIDFRRFAGINLQFNGSLSAAYGGQAYISADGVNRVMPVTWLGSWVGHSTYAHEMGHAFGLPHSSGPYSETYDSGWDVMSRSSSTQTPESESIAQHTISYHKDILGWIPETRRFVAAPGSRRTVVIDPLETPDGTGYLMAMVPLAGGAFYSLEVRRRVGYDTGLPGEGVIIHRVVPTRDRAARVVDADGDGDPNDEGAIWLPGERLTDPLYSIAISVDAAVGSGYQVTVSLAAPLAVLSDSVRRAGLVQVPYADTLRVDGGVAAYTWTLVEGSLPPGVTLDPASGILSGTPSQGGTYRFTVQVVSGTVSALAPFRLDVYTPVRITSDSVRPPARLGAPYADTLRATGGTGTYAWTVIGGALPAGLALDGATGVLSGTATQAGIHRFAVNATSATLVAALELVVRVAGPLALPADSVRRAGTMGAAYRDTLRAEGGMTAPVWRVLDGRLPAGVALDSLTGVLAGVPTEAGEFRVAVGARSGDESAQGVARITVGKPQLQAGAVVDQLLAGSGLTAGQAHFLDLLGNRNGRVDVGDVRAWLADNPQMDVSAHPVLRQIMAAPADPGAAQPSSRGEP